MLLKTALTQGRKEKAARERERGKKKKELQETEDTYNVYCTAFAAPPRACPDGTNEGSCGR